MIDTAKIEQRIQDLSGWLGREYPEIENDHAHLDAGTTARAYWHFGYLMALKDVTRPEKTTGEAFEVL